MLVLIDSAGWIRMVHLGYKPDDEGEIERRVRQACGRIKETVVTLQPVGGTTAFSPPEQGRALAPVGTPVGEFVALDADGRDAPFARWRGGAPSVVFFWSLFCQPCREEFGQAGEPGGAPAGAGAQGARGECRFAQAAVAGGALSRGAGECHHRGLRPRTGRRAPRDRRAFRRESRRRAPSSSARTARCAPPGRGRSTRRRSPRVSVPTWPPSSVSGKGRADEANDRRRARRIPRGARPACTLDAMGQTAAPRPTRRPGGRGRTLRARRPPGLPDSALFRRGGW